MDLTGRVLLDDMQDVVQSKELNSNYINDINDITYINNINLNEMVEGVMDENVEQTLCSISPHELDAHDELSSNETKCKCKATAFAPTLEKQKSDITDQQVGGLSRIRGAMSVTGSIERAKAAITENIDSYIKMFESLKTTLCKDVDDCGAELIATLTHQVHEISSLVEENNTLVKDITQQLTLKQQFWIVENEDILMDRIRYQITKNTNTVKSIDVRSDISYEGIPIPHAAIVNRMARLTFRVKKQLCEVDVDEDDIQLVMSQSNCSRSRVIAAIRNNDNDIVNAIMELTQ